MKITRIYIVEDKEQGRKPRFVRSASGVSALRKVARETYDVRVATIEDSLRHRDAVIEDADAEAPEEVDELDQADDAAAPAVAIGEKAEA